VAALVVEVEFIIADQVYGGYRGDSGPPGLRAADRLGLNGEVEPELIGGRITDDHPALTPIWD